MSRCELAQRTYRETRNLADLSCAIILEKLVSVSSFTNHYLSLSFPPSITGMKKAALRGKNMMCYRKVGDKGNDDVFIAKAVQTSAPKAREAEASLTSLPLVRLLLLGWAHPKPQPSAASNTVGGCH